MISIETAVLVVLCVIPANACVLFLFNRHHKKQRRLADWLATMAASRAAARTYDLICERDEARKRIDKLTAQNSSTEAKYAAAKEELRIERIALAQTRKELTQVKASHTELKAYAVETTNKAVEYGIRAEFSEEEARVLGDRVDELEIEQLEEERKEPVNKATEGFLSHLVPTWLLRLVRV